MLDPFEFTFRAGAALVLLYILVMVGRAVAARIAGTNAGLVLGASLLTISLPTFPSRGGADDHELEGETGNRETLGNTGNGTVSLPETAELMQVSELGKPYLTTRMTGAERAELMTTRHEAIALLDRCCRFYKESGKPDDGTIPRFDVLKMSAEDRGAIVKNLEYSEAVSIIKNKRTFVAPEVASSCAALMQLIVSNRKRIYPVGYCERQKELLDSAVNALPEVVRGKA